MYLGRKGSTEYQLGKLFYRFVKVRGTPIVMDIMMISLKWHLLKGYNQL